MSDSAPGDATAAATAGANPETPPGPFHFHHAVPVRFRDIDALGHAHHSLILIYIEEARAAYWRDVAGRPDVDAIDYVMAEVSLRFIGRTFFPDTLDIGVRVSRLGSRSFDMEYVVRGSDGAVRATARSTQVMYDYDAARSKLLPDELRARIEAFEEDGAAPAIR